MALDFIGDITGSNDAGEAALEANRLAMAAQERMFNRQMEVMQPWNQAGLRGLEGYGSLLEDPTQLYSMPGYEFALSEGLKGLDRSGASRGMMLSGAGLKGVTRFGQDYASNQFDKGLTRYANLAGFGMPTQTASMMSTHGTNLANMFMNQGQIQAAQATAPFTNLMSMGNLAASMYTGMPLPRTGGGSSGSGSGGTIPMGEPQNYQFQPLPQLTL